jgi:hypothetical protein
MAPPTRPQPRRAARSTHRSGSFLLLRALLMALVALSLLSGIAAGLWRLGLAWPGTAGADWLGRAAMHHAALMIGGFLATVISIERAVAAKLGWAFVAPAASGLGAACLLNGFAEAGAGLLLVSALVFTAVSVLLLRRQQAEHTVLLLVAALAWLLGTVLYAAGARSGTTLPWWFAFLVLTIAAERLEMTRLMKRRPAARTGLAITLAALLSGAALSGPLPSLGGLVFGLSLALLALWLGTFDLARRTVRSQGLSRYMAICLLGGYAWLGLAGAAWAASAVGWPARDAALHALGLGFVISMIMGHAPVILPAVARIKLRFSPFFYLPLLALHLSMAWRLGVGAFSSAARTQGGVANALAIALFAATVVWAAVSHAAQARAALRAQADHTPRR